MVPQQTDDWRSVVTAEDRGRLRDWRSTFVDSVRVARAAGHDAEIDSGGALFAPDSALGGTIPDGNYRCRIVKLGAQTPGLPDFVAYPDYKCRVYHSGGRRRLVKLSGSQRIVGIIFNGGPLRDVFLGTLALGDEERTMAYGVDNLRDVAGYVERIGPSRFRLVLPRPHFESRLDVMELLPER